MRSPPSVRPFAAGLIAVAIAVPAALATSACLHARGALDRDGMLGRVLAGIVAAGGVSTPFLLIPLLVRAGLTLRARRGEDAMVGALRAAERTLWWMAWSVCAAMVALLAVLVGIVWLAGAP